VPVERAAQLSADVTGAVVSTGGVGGVRARAAELGEGAGKLIRALLVLGQVPHAAETTTGIGRGRRWLQGACTAKLTVGAVAPRSRAGAWGVLPGLTGTVVHDSLSRYDGSGQARQLCGAHLIRELTAAEQDHPEQRWHVQVRWALAELNKQAGTAREASWSQLPPHRAEPYWRACHQGVVVGLALHPRSAGRQQSPTRNRAERLRDRAGDLLRFVDDPLHVPMTANQGEGICGRSRPR
jgi:transposase